MREIFAAVYQAGESVVRIGLFALVFACALLASRKQAKTPNARQKGLTIDPTGDEAFDRHDPDAPFKDFHVDESRCELITRT